jgi:outer membrane protein insertion porin family
MEKLFVVVILVAAGGFAQTRPPARKAAPAPPAAKPAEAPAPTKWRIEGLTVEGARIFSAAQVLEIAGLQPGQIAGRPEFEAARDRLTACGAFETVSYKFGPSATGGFAGVFQVTEVQQVYPVEFQELAVSNLELRSALAAKDPLFSGSRLPATQPVFERYRKWVEEFLAAKGVPEKIAGSVMPAAPGDYAIVFRPARNLPAVAQVSFQGNELLNAEVLGDAVFGAAIGSAYTEDLFRQILNSSVRPRYEARGRLRVAFPQVRAEKSKDVEGVNVFVTVDEGPGFELAKVTVEGPTPVPADALVKAAAIKTGEAANFDKVAEGLERMRQTLRRAGYMEAKVASERRIDDTKKTVEVVVRAQPGPVFTMGKLTIAGLDLHGESEMRRIWNLKEGRPFNPDYPEMFLNRVREQAMFDNLSQTKAELKTNAADHTVDVTLKFAGDAGGRGR